MCGGGGGGPNKYYKKTDYGPLPDLRSDPVERNDPAYKGVKRNGVSRRSLLNPLLED
jgi:hypothetical protein